MYFLHSQQQYKELDGRETTTMTLRLTLDAAFHSGLVPVYFVLLVILVGFLYGELARYNLSLKTLPGPSGLPIFGSFLKVQNRKETVAEYYRKISAQYGPVFQVMLGNMPVVVVNTAEAARDLFIDMGSSINTRPMFYTFHGVLGGTSGFSIGASPWDESCKNRRKAASSALNRPAVLSYLPLLDMEVRDFVHDLWTRGDKGNNPCFVLPFTKRLALNMSLSLCYGIRLASVDDDLFKEIAYVEEEVSKFRSTTGSMQDYIPLARFFSGRSAYAKSLRTRRDKYLTMYLENLKSSVKDGTVKPCIGANVLKDPDQKLNEKELMSVCITMVSGGTNTLTSTLSWTIAYLATHKELQERLYKEITEIHGTEWLSEIQEDSTYVKNFVKEALRYFTVLRINLPRATSKDIHYRGMFIPAQTTILLNSWACNNDPAAYPEPRKFDPDRWLHINSAKDSGTPHFSYGAGSRMCAGTILANRELYIILCHLVRECFIAQRLTSVSDHDFQN